MKTLDIVIMSHNRATYLEQMLNSVFAALKGFKSQIIDISVYVSDNSDDQPRMRSIVSKFDLFQFVDRRKCLSSHQHLSSCFSGSSSDFLVILHDDDLVVPSFFDICEENINLLDEQNLGGVGFNASIIFGEKLNAEFFFPRSLDFRVFRSSRSIGALYFLTRSINYAPFPFYLYDAKKAREVLPSINSKYIDTIFLALLAEQYGVAIVNTEIGSYRFHETNDSASASSRELFRCSLDGFLRFQFLFGAYAFVSALRVSLHLFFRG